MTKIIINNYNYTYKKTLTSFLHKKIEYKKQNKTIQLQMVTSRSMVLDLINTCFGII